MRNIYSFVIALLLTVSVFAQSPEKMSYQAVIRNSSNALVTSTAVGMKICILQGSASGSAVYVETQIPSTNANGLVSIEIGNGTVVNGNFATIDWANGPYFIKTEIDPTGGISYAITGTSQLLSVPYALYAKTANEVLGLNDTLASKAVLLTSNQTIAGNKTFTGAVHPYSIEVNSFNTGNRDAFIDFHGDDTYTNYALRLCRTSTGRSRLEHRGTEQLIIQTNDSASISFATKELERMNIDANGNIMTNGQMKHLNTEQIYDISGKTLFLRQDGVNSFISNKKDFLASGTPKNGLLFINGSSGISLCYGDNGWIGTEAMSINKLGINMNNNQVTNVKKPVNAEDAVNKAYVDALIAQIQSVVKDYDGNLYTTITIGTQVWMGENLKTTHYADGTAIPVVNLVNTTPTWDALTATSKAYCWYNDNIVNKSTYGALYTWAAAMNGAASSAVIPSGIQGVCPTGWHLPSDAEWIDLTNYLSGERFAGGKLKETGTTHWHSPNTGATNQSGFTALPGGYRYIDGVFTNVGNGGTWWNATESNAANARNFGIDYSYNGVYRNIGSKALGLYVRCVRD